MNAKDMNKKLISIIGMSLAVTVALAQNPFV